MTALNIPVLVLGSATAGRKPGDGTLRALNQRELCLNTTDQILYYLNAAGTLIAFPVNPTLFAMLASPALSGSPTAPTPASGDNSTRIATTAFVQAIAGLLAPLASPALTGSPTAPTAAALSNSTQVATTAYADKAVAAATARTPVSNGNYAALTTDRLIAYTALAAASTVTLPPSGSFPKGASIIVVDEAGAATGSLTITLAPNGSEKINGASSYVIAAAYGYVQVETNGTNWTVIDSNAFSSSALGSSAPAMNGTGAAGSASTASRSDHVHPSDTSRLAAANNLSDLAALGTALTNLGLTGSLSTTSGSIRLPISGGALFLIYGVASVSGDATVSMSNSFPNNNFGGLVQSISTFSANQSGQPVFAANLDPSGFSKSSFVIRPYQIGSSGTSSLGYTTKFFYIMLGN